MDGMEELRQTFFTECGELLTDMEERLLNLQEEVFDADALNAIFRCAHSIKGGAGAFGFDPIMQFTHMMEALLDEMRSGTLLPTRGSIDTLLRSSDIVVQMLAQAQQNVPIDASLGTAALAELKALVEGAGEAAPDPVDDEIHVPESTSAEKTWHIRFAPKPDMFASGNDPWHLLRALNRLGRMAVTTDISRLPQWLDFEPTQCYLAWDIRLETSESREAILDIFEFVQDLTELTLQCETAEAEAPAPAPAVAAQSPAEQPAATATATPKPAAAPAEPPATAPAAPSTAATIRVDIEKVDKLVNMVGELVITEAMLRAQSRLAPLEQLPDLLRGLDELSHHTRELQEAVMAVRMQPVKSIFSRMPRIVRDTSAQLGKDVQLILIGENTEVDKTVIEQLGDPLTHMIRNSVDHGIEMPDVREANGKPRLGTIQLSATHRSGRILIEIKDDGAGINRGRVLAKAQEKGLVSKDSILSDEEVDHLVFAPGFSTAEQVTSVSGRGVGMDVVKRNIESLGGTVRITNNPGSGSIFTISLPLTLAILDGMIVRVGAENYIVPITSILETLRPRAADLHAVQGHADVLNVRGEFVPLIYLHDIFSVPLAERDPTRALIVLVENGSSKMGLVVDELIGQQQVVIKSLEANADPVKGISGATILGDGKVSLILEINELTNMGGAYSGIQAA